MEQKFLLISLTNGDKHYVLDESTIDLGHIHVRGSTPIKYEEYRHTETDNGYCLTKVGIIYIMPEHICSFATI